MVLLQITQESININKSGMYKLTYPDIGKTGHSFKIRFNKHYCTQTLKKKQIIISQIISFAQTMILLLRENGQQLDLLDSKSSSSKQLTAVTVGMIYT